MTDEEAILVQCETLDEILEFSRVKLSNLKPSEWVEQNRRMGTEETQFAGPFSYRRTPFTRELVDCFSPDHPGKYFAMMKGAQVGFSVGVLEGGICYTISQNPCNILFLTGHSELSEEAVGKLDIAIDHSGIRDLIKPTAQRKKSNKTGDTNTKKEFPGGSLVSGSIGNHKLLRQRSVRIVIADDFDAAKSKSKESGSTRKLMEQRAASYYSTMKMFFLSSPELEANSNILEVYNLGDKRKFYVPCPCCGAFITLEWSTPLKGSDKEKAGITWNLDSEGGLIVESVGYICQECGDFFTDRNKLEWMNHGKWIPTCKPQNPDYYSYHINSLYGPPGTFDWVKYVRDWMEANPPDQPQKQDLQQSFDNLTLGIPFQPTGLSPKASDMQKNNIRRYEIGTIPEKLSLKDGNGKIVLLTCAADMNGVAEDARLDWEIVAWSESGASYSILHGSVGTFIPREGNMKIKIEREKLSYDASKPNNVWKEFLKVINGNYYTDTDHPRRMQIFTTGLDVGHLKEYAWPFIDKNVRVVGLKGVPETFIKQGTDRRSFRLSKERPNLYLVEVNMVKDYLNDLINLKFDEMNDEHQPPGYMNYPTPSGGLYLYKNFFEQYESEHKVVETDDDGKVLGYIWDKKQSNSQNHFWDVRVYNLVVKDILTYQMCTMFKIKNYTWDDFVRIILGGKTGDQAKLF